MGEDSEAGVMVEYHIVILLEIGGHPAPGGACPTQPYKCGRNVKVKINVKVNVVLTLTLTF